MIAFEIKLTRARVDELFENDLKHDYIMSTDPLIELSVRHILCDIKAKDVDCQMIINEITPSISLLFTCETDCNLSKIINEIKKSVPYIEEILY